MYVCAQCTLILLLYILNLNLILIARFLARKLCENRSNDYNNIAEQIDVDHGRFFLLCTPLTN